MSPRRHNARELLKQLRVKPFRNAEGRLISFEFSTLFYSRRGAAKIAAAIPDVVMELTPRWFSWLRDDDVF